MMSIRNLIYLISFVLVLSLAGSAQSDVLPPAVSVNFGFDGDDATLLAPADVAGGPGYASANWNNAIGLTGTLAAGTVTDSTGAVVSGMEITWNAGNEWTLWDPIFPATPGDKKLWFKGEIATLATPGTITVTNIPYDEYHVVMYFGSNWYDRGAETTVAESGITYVGMPYNGELTHTGFDGTYILTTSTDPDNPTELGNYSVHTGLTNSTAEISWTPLTGAGMETGEGWAVGFQIIPEPATIALLGLGGLALLRRRKGR